MRYPHLILAVVSPMDIDPVTVDKAVRLATALDGEIELFECVFDRRLAHSGRFTPRAIEQNIRNFVESHHRQLERLAARLRARGVRARSSVRWDWPPHEGILRQALRHQP
jgi:hypothetical protein